MSLALKNTATAFVHATASIKRCVALQGNLPTQKRVNRSVLHGS
jgi:hypothetical protein